MSQRKATHISISGRLHPRLAARAKADGVPMAYIVELAIASDLGLPAPKLRTPKK